MKRVYLLLAVMLTWTTALFAQTGSQQSQQLLIDVIHLTDGKVVKGIIVEQIPAVRYTITTADGESHTIDALNIEKITREPAESPAVVEKINHLYFHNPYISVRYDENGNAILPLNPREAFSGSLIMPGLGQIFNGQVSKGALLMMGATAGILGMTLGTAAAPEYEDAIGYTSLALFVGSYLYSLFDAPIYAKRWNVSHGFPANGNISVDVMPIIDVIVNRGASIGVGASLNF